MRPITDLQYMPGGYVEHAVRWGDSEYFIRYRWRPWDIETMHVTVEVGSDPFNGKEYHDPVLRKVVLDYLLADDRYAGLSLSKYVQKMLGDPEFDDEN